MAANMLKALSRGTRIRSVVRRLTAAKSKMAEFARPESGGASAVSISAVSDDQSDLVPAGRPLGELERWLRAAEARLIASDRPSLAARLRSRCSWLFGGLTR